MNKGQPTLRKCSRAIDVSAHFDGTSITSGEIVAAARTVAFIVSSSIAASEEVNSSRKFSGSSRPAATVSLNRCEWKARARN
jgi:hypothetical protein